jgi:hypothetical protein
MLLAASQRRYEVEWTHILVFIFKVHNLLVSLLVGKTKKESKKTWISNKRTAQLATFRWLLKSQILKPHSYNVAVGIGLFIDSRLKTKEL